MDIQYFKLESGKPVATSREAYAEWLASEAYTEYRLEHTVQRDGFSYIVTTAFNGEVKDPAVLNKLDLFSTTFSKQDATGEEQQPEVYTWPTFAVATDMHHKIVRILADNPAATPALLEVKA